MHQTFFRNQEALKDDEKLTHIFISRYLPGTEYIHQKNLRAEIREIVSNANQDGEVEFDGKMLI